MISKIRALSAVFYTLLAIPFAILLMYLFKNVQRKIRQITAKIFIILFGVRAEIKGELDPSAQILLINHQSFMDVIYLEAIHPNNLCWIAKKELGKPFLYGHALKAPKMILINRESKREIVFLLKEAKDRLEQGRTLCIFPEGTRSKGEEKLLPFKNGAKLLVEHFNLKVQPIVICGTRKCLDIGALKFPNTTFTLQYLPAFTPQDTQWFEALKTQMQETYSQMYLESQNTQSKG
ncbi:MULTISPECIES: lysophospholipid acyltransferase family protein [Helicobacter]|uniref:1-acyl-sn-glycerol-3-phosphate acyltransferase n=1 Tax=Helicobacter ganmani TaxID=60246 RepID=A0A3D8IAQ4_9HELI|nr:MULTISPECIES: lysophospholipid acyltransferase family protein [Helicobacter]RDU62178.1 1-acyl-sn-glycerol-3-phosphate acyltransferase [Helicobacter ganmani]